jgi:hypothetical protein
MNEAELRTRSRDLLSLGQMPRVLPTTVRPEVSRSVTEPRIQIGLQPAEHSFLCGELGPAVSCTYPDGRVMRLHDRCNILWHEERGRA